MHRDRFLLSRCVLAACLLFTINNYGYGQIIQSGAKSDSIDYERLAKIDNLVNDYIKKDWVKGVVTLVVKDNKIIQYKGYGYADAEAKSPMPADELFRIASQTKAITATAVMILYEQGKLLLDDPVSKYIPEFGDMKVLDKFNSSDSSYTTVPAKRGITIRDLLTHTSGIDYAVIGNPDMVGIYQKAGIYPGFNMMDKSQTLEQAMKKLATLPLIHQPGEKWTYGLNSDLLGYLIEKLSGETLETFLTKNIFDPLGMSDTYFNVPKSKAARLATVYTEDSLHHVTAWEKSKDPADPNYPLLTKTYFSGGADLTSTALDYAKFLQMFLNKGVYNGHRILSPRTVEMMTSNQLSFHFNETDDFGLGFSIVNELGAARGPRSEGSFAWGGYFGTTYWADPKERMVCLIMTQQIPNSHGDLTPKIEDMIYASLKY